MNSNASTSSPGLNLNGRPGSINDLTWSLVREIRKEGQYDYDNHKTGSYYDIKLKFHKDQFPLLKRLKGEFKKNHGYVGTVFDTQKNKRPFPGQLYRSSRRISIGIQFVKVGDIFFITNMNRAMKNWHSTKHKALTGRRQQKDIM